MWKHYLPATSLAGGNDEQTYSLHDQIWNNLNIELVLNLKDTGYQLS